MPRLPSAHRLLERAQVDLRLAAAGDAVQQERLRPGRASSAAAIGVEGALPAPASAAAPRAARRCGRPAGRARPPRRAPRSGPASASGRSSRQADARRAAAAPRPAASRPSSSSSRSAVASRALALPPQHRSIAASTLHRRRRQVDITHRLRPHAGPRQAVAALRRSPRCDELRQRRRDARSASTLASRSPCASTRPLLDEVLEHGALARRQACSASSSSALSSDS